MHDSNCGQGTIYGFVTIEKSGRMTGGHILEE